MLQVAVSVGGGGGGRNESKPGKDTSRWKAYRWGGEGRSTWWEGGEPDTACLGLLKTWDWPIAAVRGCSISQTDVASDGPPTLEAKIHI